MENLNAETIKKALECCASPQNLCEECPIDQKKKDDCFCGQFLAENALALITSQEQRIKELMSTSPLQGAIIGCLRTTANELTADKERLEKLLDDKCDRCIERERADTVRKYREKLYRELAYLGAKDKFNKEFFLTTADQIAKEMLEGNYK